MQEPTERTETPLFDQPTSDDHQVDYSASAPGSETPDPMAQFFGEREGTFKDPQADENVPEEIELAFLEYGLSKKSFRCVIKQGTNIIRETFNNCYPSLDWMKKNLGPGKYTMVFWWRIDSAEAKATKKKQHQSHTVHIELSEDCRRIYRNHQLELQLQDAKQNKDKVAEAMVSGIIDNQMVELQNSIDGNKTNNKKPEDTDITQKAQQRIQESIDMAKAMGMTRMDMIPQQSSSSIEKWMPMLSAALPVILKMITESGARREEQFMKMFTLMNSMNTQSTNQAMEMMKAQLENNTGQKQVDQLMNMISSAIDMKELLTPEKEGLADKLFKLAEGVAPHIAAIATAPKAQQAIDPRAMLAKQFVQGNPDFQALAQADNRDELIKFYNRLDDFFGWDQTDHIMKVMYENQIERPDECPRDPAKQFSINDPRRNNLNSVDEAHIEDESDPPQNIP